jgi:hypothetical protein
MGFQLALDLAIGVDSPEEPLRAAGVGRLEREICHENPSIGSPCRLNPRRPG